jgi:ABC-type glycerol-3-phosphate transport system substrate-binding protein
MKKHLGVTMAAVAGLAVAGCGGSSNRSGSYAAFDAQLNSLCTQANSASKAASGTQAKIAVVETYVNKFDALTPPAELKSIYAQWTSLYHQILNSVKSGDFANAQSQTVQSDTLASSLGAGKCAKTG